MKFAKVLGVLAVGSLMMAACGDDGEKTTASTTTGATGATAPGATGAKPTGAPIKVGLIAPQGTASFNLPGEVAAVTAGVNSINAAGGVGGRPLELVYCNDKGDPNETSTCAQKMISEKVVAVVGGALLNGGTVLTPALAQAGITQIGLTAISGPEFNSENIFLFGGGNSFGYNVLVGYGAQKGLKVALVSSDNQAAKPLRDGLNAVADGGKNPFSATVLVPATATDFAPLVQAAKAGGTNAVLLFLGAEQLTQFVAASEAAKTNFTYLTAYNWDKFDAKNFGGGEVLARVVSVAGFPPLSSDNKMVKQFVADMAAAAKAKVADADITVEGAASAASLSTGWLALYAIDKVVEQKALTDVTAATLKAALKTTTNLDFDGLILPWTPDKAGPTGLARVPDLHFHLIRYKNNEPFAITTAAVTVEELITGTVKVSQ